MKRLHVIMSIGCFIIEVCASFFSLFAYHRVINGGFDARARSASVMLVRELEYEFVAVCSYSFAGAWLLMGPVAIRSFCMVQQGLRSDFLAASVCCLIAGAVLLILSFFNAHLEAYPFDSYEQVLGRFIELSFERCAGGGRAAVIMVSAWTLQCVSVVLALLSLVGPSRRSTLRASTTTRPTAPRRRRARRRAPPPPAPRRPSATRACTARRAPPRSTRSRRRRSPPLAARAARRWRCRRRRGRRRSTRRAPPTAARPSASPPRTCCRRRRAVGGLGKRVGSLGSLPSRSPSR